MAAGGAIRAGQAYVELFTKHNRLIGGLNFAAARLKAFGAMVTGVGLRLAGLGVGLGAGLFAAARLFEQMGSDMVDMSVRTGLSVEALSELRFAAGQSGASVEELEAGVRIMSRTLDDAAQGSRTAVDELARLGLSVEDLAGLSQDQRFELFAERIAAIADPAERSAAAMGIFGRGGARLLPLMQGGARGIQELREEARRLGLTMSTEDAQAAEQFGDALSRLWAQVKMAVFHIGAGLAPVLERLAGWLSQAARVVIDFVESNREVVQIIGLVVAGLTAAGVALMLLGPAISAVGFAISLVTGAVGLLGAAITFLMSPIGLVVAAAAGLGAAFLLFTSEGQAGVGALGRGIEQLGEIFGATWSGIQDALAAGDLAGAMEIAWLGLQVAWAAGVAALSAAWREFTEFFVEAWELGVTGFALLFNDAWTGIEVAFWTVVNALANGWDWFVHGLTVAFNEFVGFFRRAWARVRNIFNREEADRQVAAINAEVEQQNAESRAALDESVARREERVQAARDAGDEREEVILGDHLREQRRRRREIDEASAADQAEIAGLQGQLQERVAQAAADREYAELERDYEEFARRLYAGGSAPPAGGPNLDANARKIDVAGTFSAFAVQGLGASSLAERTARAGEQTVRELQGIRRELGEVGGVEAT